MKKMIIHLYIKILKLLGVKVVKFIHVGKTAGSAIRHAFASKARLNGNLYLVGSYLFVMNDHHFRFLDSKSDEFVFFVVRDPVNRFVSGFYSRKREGRPKNYNPWRPAEKEAFSIFSTPRHLGEALGSSDVERKQRAEKAMNNIGHVNSSYWDWFINDEYLLRNKNKILFVLRQEHLNDDFQYFSDKFIKGLSLPSTDSVESHKNPETNDTRLSDTARANIKTWYKADYDFLNLLYNEGLLKSKYE